MAWRRLAFLKPCGELISQLSNSLQVTAPNSSSNFRL